MEKLHVQPTELDMLPYYEFEYTLELYNEFVGLSSNGTSNWLVITE